MSIFIRFRKNEEIGGPMTFMRNLKAELKKQKFQYQKTPFFAKGMFFPIAENFVLIRLTKLFGGKIIQRLDGVYYPSKNGEFYEKYNSKMKSVYKNYSDFVVFQSQYSIKQVFAMFGEIPKSKYTVIFNGANINIFYPGDNKKLHKKIRFVTTGRYRNKDMLNPVIEALDILEKKGVNFELLIIGPILLDNKDKILSRKYVKNTQTLNQKEIANQLRNSDIFIYSHLNPPCPNSVIEAVCCGLPVVGFDSGALKEICYFNTELFADVSEDIFQVYEDFDSTKLLEKIEICIANFDEYKTKSINYYKEYSMERCTEKYIKVFKQTKRTLPNLLMIKELFVYKWRLKND